MLAKHLVQLSVLIVYLYDSTFQFASGYQNMTFSEIALDSWAAGPHLVNATIIIVSICFFISCSLFTIRMRQVCRQNQTMEVSKKERMLQVCHLSAMFFSCFYIFLYVWNYVQIYTSCNEMDCAVWFVLIMVSITMTKLFMYAFLMLRSALAFRNSFFRISLRLAVSVTTVSVLSQLTMMALMLSDFTVVQLFKDKSPCFRTLGPNGTMGIAGFNISDAISSVIALLIFWTKARNVNSALFSNARVKQIKDRELDEVFSKHIRLGMLIALGSLLIFLAGEFLTILMGLASCLHQCFNNLYLFLLFKSNSKYYKACCRCKSFTAAQPSANALNLHLEEVLDRKETAGHAQQTCKSTPDPSEMPCATSVNAPTFLSKSLSSLPRYSALNQMDKKCMSSNCLELPTKLVLTNLPTLTQTPTGAAMGAKHTMQTSFTPYTATASAPLPQTTPCNIRNSGTMNFDIQSNDLPGLEIVYAE